MAVRENIEASETARSDIKVPEKFEATTGSTQSQTDSEDQIPTDEELETLRRVPGRIPWICFTVAFVELCERFAYYGTTAVLVNFIQRPLPEGSTTGSDPHLDGRPGALGFGQRASTGLTTFNRFWAYFMPLIGGYMADAHWGRMRTIQTSIAVAMFGHVVMIISAIPAVIKNPDGALGCLAVGLIFFGAGVGGFKPNISPLMVEQLREQKMRVVVRGGERIIIDPALTTQRIFMYFYFCINIGAIIGQVTMVYAERYIGFWLSFFLPTVMFLICPSVLWAFNKKYVHREATGSVLAKAVSLIKFALKGKISINPVKTVRNIQSPTFWEDVKPSNVRKKPSFMTFDDAWVDEVARGCKACGVFLFYPLFWLAYNQIEANLLSQAATMELHGVPNDLLTNLNPLGILIMIPILDKGVYPLLRRFKIRFSPLKRMAAGFFIACGAMVWAAVVQSQIYAQGKCGKYMNTCDVPAAPLNVWIQTGSYVLVGLSEIMASITGLEYAYTKAPANMRSLVFGFYHFTTALSSALGQAFVGLSEDPLLVWNYGSVAIIAFFGGVGFWLVFRGYDEQEEHLNMLPESSFRGKKTKGGPGEKKLAEVADEEAQRVRG